jgi:hypothetical protein
MQLLEDPFGDPALLPPLEPAINGLPGREVHRQLPPGTPGPVEVQDGVHDVAERITADTPSDTPQKHSLK